MSFLNYIFIFHVILWPLVRVSIIDTSCINLTFFFPMSSIISSNHFKHHYSSTINFPLSHDPIVKWLITLGSLSLPYALLIPKFSLSQNSCNVIKQVFAKNCRSIQSYSTHQSTQRYRWQSATSVRSSKLEIWTLGVSWIYYWKVLSENLSYKYSIYSLIQCQILDLRARMLSPMISNRSFQQICWSTCNQPFRCKIRHFDGNVREVSGFIQITVVKDHTWNRRNENRIRLYLLSTIF